MEISLVLTNDSGSFQTILTQFLAVNVAGTLADRVAAQAAATTATQQAGIATGAASTATAQAGIATTAAGTATTQAGIATGAASTATTQAGIAAGAASTATTQAGNASTSAGNASASATLAQNWASQATGLVGGVDYSAKFYAGQAAASAAAITIPLPITSGGTGATTQAAARSGLGAASIGTNTFGGNQTIAATTPLIQLSDTSGTNYGDIRWQNNGVQRWALRGYSTVGGLGFQVNRYDATGTLVDSPLAINGSSGLVTFVDGINAGSKLVAGVATPVATTDAANKAYVDAVPTVGRLINVQVITSSGTYTPTSGTTSIIVELIGAGGGGAGAASTASSSNLSNGGCGGAGGAVRHRYTSGFSGLSYTIGAAGAAGAAGGNGGTGGNTTFGALTASGGSGGSAAAAGTNSYGSPGAGGSASGGNILNATGARGAIGMCATNIGFIAAPFGPAHLFDGMAYGYGGNGTANGSGAAAIAGNAGGPGLVTVYEFS